MAFSIESYKGVCLYGLLFFLFMVFFGVPSIQKYQKQETIFVSSRELTNGIEAPAVTILALDNRTGYGWKSKTNLTSSEVGRYSSSFLIDHCKEINRTDLNSCIFEDTFRLTDIFISAKFGNSQTKILNSSSWTSNIDGSAYGRFFTWNPQRRISPNKKDLIYMLANRSFKFFIHVHDINFFLLNVSPLGPPKAFYEFDGNTMRNHYNELVLIKHTKLNLDHQPCEEIKDYSFTTCVKESLAQRVGCRRPWEKWNQQNQSVCTTQNQFNLYDQLFALYLMFEIDKIERLTGCLKPCHYKEYKFVNSNPKDQLLAQVPDNQISIDFWAVSEYTQFEEEVLL